MENFSAPDADTYIEFNGRRQCLDRSKCVCSAGVQSEVSRKITSADKGKYSLFKEWKNFCLTFFVKRNIINSKRVAN